MAGVIETLPRRTLALRLTPRILALQLSRAYRQPLTAPTCAKDTPPGLVTRKFHFVGKGRDTVVTVTCHAKAMVGLMKALRKVPTIQVTATAESVYSGSYRSWEQQNNLYQLYLSGKGYRAANPCYGYHRRARSLDLKDVTDEEADAMLSVRVGDLRFYWGIGFGDRPHFTLGAYG